MGETKNPPVSAAERSQRAGRSDKHHIAGWPELGDVAIEGIWAAAQRLGVTGLLKLLINQHLIRYPRLALKASVVDGELVIPRVPTRIPLDDLDRAEIEEWLSRKQRIHHVDSLYSYLSGEFVGVVREEIREICISRDLPLEWVDAVSVGVRQLRKVSLELAAEGARTGPCEWEEAVYAALVFGKDMDVLDNLRRPTAAARDIAAAAAAVIVDRIRAVMPEESKAAVARWRKEAGA